MFRFEAETRNEKKKKKFKLLRLSLEAKISFVLALTAGALLLYDYASGFVDTEGILVGLEEVIFYIVMGIALLLIRMIGRRLRKRTGTLSNSTED